MKMLSTLLTGAAAWLCFGACATAENNTMPNAEQPTYREYQQEQNLHSGTEKDRASFWSFDTLDQALNVLPENSKRFMSLDGQWHFKWRPNPPEGREVITGYKKWDLIQVPGSIQMQGYGMPIYANQPYLFDPNINGKPAWPSVMHTPQNQKFYTYKNRNEVGTYVRDFTLPGNWNGKEIYLTFEGVEGFFYAWVNDQYIGFHKDARDPARFDITRFLKPGANTLQVQVYRQHDGSYLEAQDMNRFSGIIRNVNLTALDKVHVRDFFATTDLTQDFFGMRTEGYLKPTIKKDYHGQWTVDISANVKNLFPKAKDLAGYTLEAAVYDEKGEKLTPIDRNQYESFDKRELRLTGMDEQLVQLLCTYQSPKLWSAEEPNLYTLVLTLKDPQGQIVEHVSSQLGFRKIEIYDKIFYINGQPVKLLGVNRHETNPELGHYVPRALQEKDFEIMKQGNINHVRNSHYPQDFYFYYLANKYGIYVEDEANIESHHYGYGKESISHPTEWLTAHVDRIMAMVERNKNFPCVVIWSLGNEAGPGRNFITAERTLKARDWTRPSHYERFDDRSSAVDIPSNQYAWVQTYASWAQNNPYPGPYYASEYAHNMNNAMGVQDYADAFRSGPYCVGGAIWDFVDQGMYQPIPDDGKVIDYFGDWRWAQKQYKNRRLAYGGDWGDHPNSGQFVCNGIIFSDRTVQPVYYEIKHAYQNIAMAYQNGQFVIRNRNYFIPLDGYDFKVTVLLNGVEKQTITLDVPKCEPGQTVRINADVVQPPKDVTGILSYRFSAQLKKATPWAPAGFEIASDQSDVSVTPEQWKAPNTFAGNKSETDKTLTFKLKGAEVTFDKTTAALTSYKVNGEEMLKEPMRVNAFRAPSTNDNRNRSAWAANGLRVMNSTVKNFEVKKTSNSYTIDVTFDARGERSESYDGFGGNQCTIKTGREITSNAAQCFKVNGKWEIFDNGAVAFHSVLLPTGKSIELPQVGYEFMFNPNLSNVKYLGFGPYENYPDRVAGSYLGVYSTTAAEMFVPYSRPQCTGMRLNTFAFDLTDKAGNGLRISALDAPFAFNCVPYTNAQLIETMHPADMPKSEQTFVTLSSAVRGLGSDVCGPTPLEKYIIRGDRPYPLSFIIEPITKGQKQALKVLAMPEVKLDQTMTKFEPKFRVLQTPSQENPNSEAFVNCLDGDPTTIWHSQYGVTMGAYPYTFELDMKKAKKLKGITSLPRQDGVNGRIKGYKVELSSDGKSYETVAEGEFENSSRRQRVMFKKPVEARYIRFTATSEQGGRAYCSMAEFDIIE